MVPLGPHRPWTGGGQTGAPALSHTLSPSRHSHLPGVTCPVHAPGPPRDSSGAAAEASSSGSGFWVPLAWSWQLPSTPTQSPTERGDGTCYLGPAEGTPSLSCPRSAWTIAHCTKDSTCSSPWRASEAPSPPGHRGLPLPCPRAAHLLADMPGCSSRAARRPEAHPWLHSWEPAEAGCELVSGWL